MKLAWITDPHLNLVSRRQVEHLARAAAALSDAVVISGDIAEHGSRQLLRFALDYRTFKRGTGETYFVLGNHDAWGTSIEGAQQSARALAEKTNGLTYAHNTTIPLGNGTVLVGHDGWYDARAGNPLTTNVRLNDWHRVEDFSEPDGMYGHGSNVMPRTELVELLQRRGVVRAAEARAMLEALPADTKRVLFLTHVPPFTDAARAAGCDSDHLPWYTNLSLGRELTEWAAEHPTVNVTVLCGHMHGQADVPFLSNLRCRVGPAEYQSPAIVGVFDLDLWASYGRLVG